MNIFSSKPSALLYLRRQDAVLITKSTSARFNIPLEITFNLEIRDAATMSDIIAQFLADHKVHGRQVLLVLDSEVTFQKQLPATTDTQAAFKDFTDKVPFDPEIKQLIQTRQKDQTTFYGVNKVWYEAVASGVRRDNKLKAVVPAHAYGVHSGKKIDRDTIMTFFQNNQPIRSANFLLKA